MKSKKNTPTPTGLADVNVGRLRRSRKLTTSGSIDLKRFDEMTSSVDEPVAINRPAVELSRMESITPRGGQQSSPTIGAMRFAYGTLQDRFRGIQQQPFATLLG